MLQRFFETFWYIKNHVTVNNDELDANAKNMIKGIVQEIKEVWDPSGIDAYLGGSWIGLGDSQSIKDFNVLYTTVYGDYAEAKSKYLRDKASGSVVPSTQTKPVTATNTTTPTTSTPIQKSNGVSKKPAQRKPISAL